MSQPTFTADQLTAAFDRAEAETSEKFAGATCSIKDKDGIETCPICWFRIRTKAALGVKPDKTAVCHGNLDAEAKGGEAGSDDLEWLMPDFWQRGHLIIGARSRSTGLCYSVDVNYAEGEAAARAEVLRVLGAAVAAVRSAGVEATGGRA